MEREESPNTATHREPLRNWLVPLVVYSVFGTVLLWDAFANFDYLGGKDWNSFIGQAEAEITSLREYKQFPLWNPWRAGGQVSAAQPESMFYSPVTPFLMVFGVVTGFKIAILPIFIFGCLGMWALAGQLGLGGASRFVPGFALFGCSLYPLYLTGGIPCWMLGLALLPWLFLCHRRAFEDPRFIVPGAAAYGCVLIGGNVFHFVFFPLILAVDAVANAIEQRHWKPLATTVAIGLLGVCFASIKLVPLAEVFLETPREMGVEGRYLTWPLLIRAFLGSQLPDLQSLLGPWVGTGAARVYWVNIGSYMGPVTVGIALLGASYGHRQTWHFSAIALLFAWLSLGDGVGISLWNALHQLPVFGSMQAPGRLVVGVAFALALLAGFGFAICERAAKALALPPALRSVGLLLLGTAMLLPMLSVNREIAQYAFQIEPESGMETRSLFAAPVERAVFFQTAGVHHPEQWGGRLLPYVLMNQGNVIGESNIPASGKARRRGGRHYRGEAYLLSGDSDVSAEFTPNVVRIHASVRQNDRLVVNQNYARGWRAEGTVEGDAEPSSRGLISLRVEPGEHDIALHYRPASFRIGATLTAISGLLGLLFVVKPR